MLHATPMAWQWCVVLTKALCRMSAQRNIYNIYIYMKINMKVVFDYVTKTYTHLHMCILKSFLRDQHNQSLLGPAGTPSALVAFGIRSYERLKHLSRNMWNRKGEIEATINLGPASVVPDAEETITTITEK